MIWLLFFTRSARLFAYGFLSVILALYLAQIGLTETQIGLLLTLALLGDTAISLWITTNADRVGRRAMLLLGAWLMLVAGLAFAFTHNFWLLLLAATVGVISLRYPHDEENLAHQFEVYDALYAWCRLHAAKRQ